MITGQDLQQLLFSKWGRSYDVQLRRTQGKIFLQVMWKYLEQASFPLSPTEFINHLDQVASYLNQWGVADQVRLFVQQTREKPRLGKAVNIPLDLGAQASEWLLDDF